MRTQVEDQHFGIRTFAFDKDRGFILNDVPTKLKGVCMHHDAGAVGVAVPVSPLLLIPPLM